MKAKDGTTNTSTRLFPVRKPHQGFWTNQTAQRLLTYQSYRGTMLSVLLSAQWNCESISGAQFQSSQLEIFAPERSERLYLAWQRMLWPRNYQREDDRSMQSSVGSVIVMTAVLFLEIVLKVMSPTRHCLYQWTINIFECISFGLNMAEGNILNASAVTILFIGYLGW